MQRKLDRFLTKAQSLKQQGLTLLKDIPIIKQLLAIARQDNTIKKYHWFIIGLTGLALAMHTYLFQNEFLVANNTGNVKIVASKTKDSLSKGYMENTRSISVNGNIVTKDELLRNEWSEYGGGLAIPINVGKPSDDNEAPTMEIQLEENVRNIFFEYSTYDVGGFLQVYIDNELVTQINTYGTELIYKPLFISAPRQILGINKSNVFWWAQWLVFASSFIIFIKYGIYKKLDWTKLLLPLLLFVVANFLLTKVLSFTPSQNFVLSNTLMTPIKARLVLATSLISGMVSALVLKELAKTKLFVLGQIAYLALIIPTPFLARYLLEAPTLTSSYLDPKTTTTNLILISLAWLCLSLISASLRRGSALLLIITTVMGIVHKILIHLRSTPLLSYFFLQIFDGLSIVKNTSFVLENSIPSLVVLTALYSFNLLQLPAWSSLSRRLNEWALSFVKQKPKPLNFLSWRPLRKGLVSLVGIFITIWFARPLAYHIANKETVELHFFSMQKTYFQYGFALSFTKFDEASQISKPQGYSATVVEDFLKQYPQKEVTNQSYPNIIIIQNEALTDYSTLTNLTFNTDPLEFIHSLTENTILGATYTSVLGGGTANSEYEALTSNSLAILPPNSFPYQQVINSDKNSLPRTLANYGYKTIGMHPYVQNFYRRNLVYPYLGFQESYFENSTPQIADLVEVKKLRNYISDDSLYQASQKLMAENEKPIFNFIVTMQGHETYGIPEEQNPRTVTTTNAQANEPMKDFLSSVKASDQAFKDFLTDLKESQEPTIVIMYGDHQPNITTTYFAPFLNANDPSSRYQTPFVMWANFDIPEAKEVKLSPNYIAPYLMQVLSQTDHALPISSYYQFLSEVQKEIPVMTTWGYYDAAGNYSEKSPESERYRQYQMIQYNNVMDKKALQMTDYYQ